MSRSEACEYLHSESLRSIYDNQSAPINCGCVKVGFAVISCLLPFSLLANSAFYASDTGCKSISCWAIASSNSAGVIASSVFIGVVITVSLLFFASKEASWPPTVPASVVIFLGYIGGTVAFDQVLADSSFSLAFIGLASIHAVLVLLLGRRLTDPLAPSTSSLNNPEQYLETLRYIDRTTLTVGIGLIFGILLAITPGGSGIKTRDTVALLSGPIGLTLLLVISVGILRMRSIRKEMDG